VASEVDGAGNGGGRSFTRTHAYEIENGDRKRHGYWM
jgi:hypothetical protein